MTGLPVDSPSMPQRERPQTRSSDPEWVRFGVFQADLSAGRLLRRGVEVPLAEQPFRLLAELLRRQGEIVTRNELRRALWPPGIHVDYDTSLNAAVKKLREALGDSAREPRYIETLPKRGYRFLAPAETLRSESSSPGGRPGKAAATRTAPLLAAGTAILLLTAFGLLRSRQAPEPGTPERAMLAVLPLDNLTGGADREYFADGLTEELITHLGRLDPASLGVIARRSAMTYKDSPKSIGRIGRELGVQYVLQGGARRNQDQVRVTVQLIAVSDETHLWAETYDVSRRDLLRVQQEISRKIAEALALELLPGSTAALVRASTSDTEAYEEYLRGQAELGRASEAGDRAALGHFRRAVGADPEFARGWAAVAAALNRLAFSKHGVRDEVFPEARRAALRALEIEPYLAEAQRALGITRLYYDFDPGAAEESFRRAVELSPNLASAHHWRAGALAVLERFGEAIESVRRAIDLDPAAHGKQADLGWYLVFAGRFAEAIVECERVLDLAPNQDWALECLALSYRLAGRPERALPIALRRLETRGGPVDSLPAAPAAALSAINDRMIRALLSDPDPGNGRSLALAVAYSEAGRPEQAQSWIDRAHQEREPLLVFAEIDPRLRRLGLTVAGLRRQIR